MNTPAGLPRPEAMLFDWDNTLVDNWRTIHAALNTALTAFGHAPWTLEETLQRVRESARDAFPRLFGDRWEEAREIFYDSFAREHIRTLRALPGAETLIRALAEEGIWLGVVSNKRGDFLRKEAAHLGWDRCFRRLVGAGDAEQDKPAIDPVRLALEGSGIAAGPTVWFIGDAAIDMECAHKAGCVPVLVGHGTGEDAALDRFPPHFRLQELSSLPALVPGG